MTTGSEYRTKNPDKYRVYLERARIARRERYNNDPEYRAQRIALSAAQYEKKKEEINAKRRTDAFRNKRNNLRQDSEQEQSTMRSYNRTPERRRALREALFLKKYGITHDQYDAMVAAQNGGCAICNGTNAIDKWKSGLRNLQVDHCHETGAVRGLLCFHCNTGLGHFRDSPELLAKALAYIKSSSL